MDLKVRFNTGPIADLLTPSEREQLLQRHPDGEANFWGAATSFDSRMDRMSTGDMVFFTGDKRLRAIGALAFKTINSELANALWPPDAGEPGWSNVYSVSNLSTVVDVGYTELSILIGYKENYAFPGAVLLDPDRSATVLRGLGVELEPEQNDQDGTQSAADAESLSVLRRALGVIPLEKSNVDETSYDRDGGHIVVRRTEAILVRTYTERLPAGSHWRIRTSTGFADIYLRQERELIEAKSSSRHDYVREALAQLLDYAYHSNEAIERLSGLFPSRPSDVSVGPLAPVRH